MHLALSNVDKVVPVLTISNDVMITVITAYEVVIVSLNKVSYSSIYCPPFLCNNMLHFLNSIICHIATQFNAYFCKVDIIRYNMIKGVVMAKTTLGEKLLELRTDRKLTQQQVSEALHIGRVTYTYYEGNKRTPDLSMLLSICKFYGIEIKELINENIIPVSNLETKAVATTALAATTPNFGMNLVSGVLEGVLADNGIKMPLTKMEKELIKNFRQLNSDDRAEVCHLIKYKLRKQKKR